MSIVLIIVLDLHLWRCNKKAKAGERRNEGLEGWMYTL